MKRIGRLLVLAALLSGMAVVATAQEMLAKKVSLDLKAMAPAEAFKVLANAIGTTVTVDPAVSAPVDILVRNVSARTALNTICESIGCRWTADASGIAVKPRGEFAVIEGGPGRQTRAAVERDRAGVDRLRGLFKWQLPPGMKFENAPLSTVNARLSEALKSQITISCGDPSVQSVTADVSNMTLMEAIKVITNQAQTKGMTWRITLKEADGQKTPAIAIMVGGETKKKR
jgi:hypothetical protein